MSLEGSGVLVTGSTSGIGESIATGFASRDANVVVTGRDRARGKSVVKRLDGLGTGRCTFIAADLATTEGPRKLAAAAEKWLGGVDVLVNNAARYFVDAVPLEADRFDEIFYVNVRAPHLLSTALMLRMAERGKGSIINITSPTAYRGYPGMAAYGASKAALDLLSKTWAAEFGRSGIRVNTVSPGPVMTPGVREVVNADIDIPKVVLARTGIVAGRVARGDEISAAVIFLAGEEASYITGATLHVDGGMNNVGSLWSAPD